MRSYLIERKNALFSTGGSSHTRSCEVSHITSISESSVQFSFSASLPAPSREKHESERPEMNTRGALTRLSFATRLTSVSLLSRTILRHHLAAAYAPQLEGALVVGT